MCAISWACCGQAPRTVQLKPQQPSISSSGGQKSEIRVLAGLAPFETVRRTCYGPPPRFHSLRRPSAWTWCRPSCMSLCVQIPPLHKDTVTLDQASPNSLILTWSAAKTQFPNNLTRTGHGGQDFSIFLGGSNSTRNRYMGRDRKSEGVGTRQQS